MKTLIKVKVVTYSYLSLLEYVKNNGLKIYDLCVLDQYTYTFCCDYKTLRKLKKDYKDLKIINSNSIRMFFLTLFSNKLVIICLILSSLLYFYLSNLIMVVNINGTSNEINQIIELELGKQNLKKYSYMPSVNRLKEIENEIYFKYSDSLDLFSLVKNGNYIVVNYERKKDKLILEEKQGKIYSKKDAIISKILISSGNVLVKENQFVRANELIVDDYIYKDEKPIYLGTKGLIYGYTYNKVEISYADQTIENVFIISRYLVAKDFILEEKILEETIIKDNEEQKILTIHYKCEEILNLY